MMSKPFWMAAMLAVLAFGPARAAEYYVATNGNDAWSGTLAAPNAGQTDGPFATLARARDAIRARKKEGALGGITVFVRGGRYALPQTLKLGVEDSGTAESPIVYRAYQGERPILVGGRQVKRFVPHRGEILQADLAAEGLQGVVFRQLFFDGQRQHLARYPNFDPDNPYGGGWAYVDGQVVSMYQDIPGENRHTLVYRPQDARRWSRPDEGEVFVFPRYNWWNNILRIKSLDAQKRQITLAADASYAIRPGDRYYVRNLLEELDAPGEWYLDRQGATLYFWPPAPLANRPVHVPTTRTILEIGPGAAHLTFRGFTLECCEGTAVVLKGTSHCVIAANTIRNVGDYHGSGVAVEGGFGNGVVGNDISQTGSHGVTLSGGDRKTLAAAENYADNNYIHHVGVFYKQGVGVMLHGVGNRATHNLIHDGPRMGILFSGNNLLIECNHIRHVNLETEDTGAVYTGGRDWISSRGTVIRHNYFHDILGFGRDKDRWVSPHFAWGVYLDDNAGGVDVIGNIVVRAFRAGLHMHNARDNLIENNIFVDSALQQIEANGWTRDHRYWTGHLPTMIEGYEMVAGQPAWQKMRNMHTHPKDAVLPDGKIMSGNVLRRNIIYYRQPDAKLFSLRNVPLDHFASDHNLVWHFGRPLLTGQVRAGKPLSGNLVANPRFETGPVGKMPEGWNWQMRPEKSTAALVRLPAGQGQQALRITGGIGKEPNGRPFHPQVVSAEFGVRPGHCYRLAARMKSDCPSAKASLMLQSYLANKYFWGSSPNEVTVGTDWTSCEFVFKVPAAGERGYHDEMKRFRVRIDLRQTEGELLVDDVALVEVEMLDEWAAWQALGFDTHSLVADPLFVDPDKDDYRLKPDSPAFKLGFQPIPVEKIGPYPDDLRASWPIVEEPGAREKPLSRAVKP